MKANKNFFRQHSFVSSLVLSIPEQFCWFSLSATFAMEMKNNFIFGFKSFSLSFARRQHMDTVVGKRNPRPECRMEFEMLPYLSLRVPFTWAASLFLPFLHASKAQKSEKCE